MAQRRMFSKTITNSSNFLMMSPTAQLLYVHFGMNADDDGFVEYFAIMRMTESKPDDLRSLVERGFVKVFDTKVLIVSDWKENNYIQKDRYTASKYLEVYKKELEQIASSTQCIQNVYKMDTQVRLGQGSVGKVRKEKIVSPSAPQVFSLKETLEKWEKDGERKFDILSWYIKKKNLNPINQEQLQNIVSMNIKWAKGLESYQDNQIVDSANRAIKITEEWNLHSVLKLIK